MKTKDNYNSIKRIIELARCGLHHNYPHQDDLHQKEHDDFNKAIEVFKSQESDLVKAKKK